MSVQGRKAWARGGARLTYAIAATALLLAACGGGGGGADSGSSDPNSVAAYAEKPAARAEAARFLTQATFGPTDADVDRVMSIGYGRWIDEQLAKPASSNRALWESADAAIKAKDPNPGAGRNEMINAFWTLALRGDDQLRQRVAFALSQIFVISMYDGAVGDNPRAAAAYLDMLGVKGLGNYRDLLEGVARHPLMGSYLTSIKNQKADARTGRVPDENFAREVMQLMSIGLHELNADGSEKFANGRPIDTYDQTDIAGMARVFTGWSWDCPDGPDNSCFFWGSANGNSDPDRYFKPMQGFAQYHSPEEKHFLGVTIPAQSKADPELSLRIALDTLYKHPNVGPFIGRQLIQRLVTSNPSPQYVAAVTAAFNDNGAGVRGDMKAVVKAVLMNAEARRMSSTSGKVREPVLKLSAFLRAFPFKSDSGGYRVGNTDNAGDRLGQTVLHAPSVFNFYRPGYVPPGTEAARLSLAAPEMQLAQETTAAGYVNYMRDNVAYGVGDWNDTINGVAYKRRDLQGDFSAELALADKPADLVARIDAKLMYGSMPAELRNEIVTTVGKLSLRALNAAKTNQKQVDDDRRNRVNAALFLTLVSPEFQVQP